MLNYISLMIWLIPGQYRHCKSNTIEFMRSTSNKKEVPIRDFVQHLGREGVRGGRGAGKADYPLTGFY